MVQANAQMEELVTFEAYMARYESQNIYFSKLADFATCGRVSAVTRQTAINLAIAKAKALKKIG